MMEIKTHTHDLLVQSREALSNYPETDVTIYGTYPGITDSNFVMMTGHDRSASGIFSFPSVSPYAELMTVENSMEAQQLSEIAHREIVLAKLVPKPYVDLGIIAVAKEFPRIISDPENTVISVMREGGLWLYDRLTTLVPALSKMDRQDVDVKTSSGDTLGEPVIVRDFDDIAGKEVVVIDDMTDRNHSIAKVLKSIKEHGGKRASFVALYNKFGVKNKLYIPQIRKVGLGVPGEYWLMGAGADAEQNIGRNCEDIWVKFTREAWTEYVIAAAGPTALLGLADGN